MSEEWRPVVGFEGRYEVSSLGRVKAVTRTDAWGRPEHIMKLTRVKLYPYHRITLSKDGKQYLRFVHVLVAEAFLGPRPPGQQIRHGPSRQPDGSTDDSVANLSYGTRAENAADMIRDGNSMYGTRSPNAKLTEKQVLEIRQKYAAGGETWKSLSRQYDVTDVLIRRVVTGEGWKHVAGMPDPGTEFCRKQKLSDDDVREIRRLHGLGVKNYELADKYQVDRSTISHILAGRTRKNVK